MIQQCKQGLNELIPTIMGDWGGKKTKNFLQYSGLTPESFSNHQNDS